MTKICSKCKAEQSLDSFYRDKNAKDGRGRWCKKCSSEHEKKKNRERRQQRLLDGWIFPENKICGRCKLYLPGTKFSKDLVSSDGLQADCKTCSSLVWKEYYITVSPETIRTRRRGYSTKRYAEEPQFKLQSRLRNRLNTVLKRGTKAGSCVRDLGCSLDKLEKHLEEKFQPGMTWENWGMGEGKWNIDHIMPLAAFDLTNRQHFLLACNYLNLQPLWFLENMKKGKKIIPLENMPTEFPSLLSNPLMPFAGTSPPADELIFL